MDDGFVLWPKNANTANMTNTAVFRELLNEQHPSLKFTVEKGKHGCTNSKLFRCFYYFTPKRSVRN